jgi:predicted XRE-type DNA-binding protein
MSATMLVKARKASKSDGDKPIVGSGEFLADRGHADPDETRLKFLICNEIALIAERRNLTQSQIARRAGVSQSDVSRIVNGAVKDYSVWRLMRVATSLGRDISIAFADSGAERGAILTQFHED